MTRRRRKRSFAGKNKEGRKLFWIRDSPVSLSLVQTNAGVLSELLLAPVDYEDPEAGLNNTKKGGARLERLVVEAGFATDADTAYYASSGDNNIANIPEFMIWVQSDQFANIITGVTSWDATRNNQRILADVIMPPVSSLTATSGTALFRHNSIMLDLKSKVRLAEMSIGFGIRAHADLSVPTLNGFTDYVRTTFLISTP